MNKPKVAFVCVHNSCRSQIAEALGKSLPQILMKAILPGQRPNRKSTRTQYGL